MVRWSFSEYLFPSWETWNRHLRSAILDGKNFGLASWKTLEKGGASGHSGTTKTALLITDSAAWTSFYNTHKPWASVPSVNFSKKSVLVVLAGWDYRKVGSQVKIQKITWGSPGSSLSVRVETTQPAGLGVLTWMNPYHIALLDGKASAGSPVLIWNGTTLTASQTGP
jgi:hypothetical protein